MRHMCRDVQIHRQTSISDWGEIVCSRERVVMISLQLEGRWAWQKRPPNQQLRRNRTSTVPSWCCWAHHVSPLTISLSPSGTCAGPLAGGGSPLSTGSQPEETSQPDDVPMKQIPVRRSQSGVRAGWGCWRPSSRPVTGRRKPSVRGRRL